MNQIHYRDLPDGITTIDTGFLSPGFAASHLIVEGDHAAFIDVGTSHSCSHLLKCLKAKGIPKENVAYVIVTHIHLDHAGGAGTLMRNLPKAKFVVHPRGVDHMADPHKLIAGATAVYGEEEMKSNYGEIVPISQERIIAANDMSSIDLNGRKLLFIDTPGHAYHHNCIVDEHSQGVFSGDTFGLSYRALDSDKGAFIFPTTSPIHFNPEAMHQSIDRIMSFNPQVVYLTHYGCVTNVQRLADCLHHMLDRFVELAKQVAMEGDKRHTLLVNGVKEILLTDLKAHEYIYSAEKALEILNLDIELNAQGLGVWLDRKMEER